ncbi:MAG: LTA synthase family protein, partial [Eubacteriales bacterium]|nr:LTA synthase family protein [Eubacteriales bacterium]
MLKKLRAFYHNEKVRNPFVWCFILAFLYNLLIETLARNQMPGYGGLYFLVTKPLVFLINTLIIYSTLLISALFRRGSFVTTLISAVWVSLGITNGIILTQRMTPFTVKDFSNLGDGATIITTYFSKMQIILILAALTIAIVSFTILFFKGPKRPEKIKYKRTLLGILIAILVTVGAVFGGIKIGILNTFFGNLAYAYEDYGVPYCFINTWLNTGIKRPANYSKKAVMSIFSKDEYMNSDGTMKLPAATNTANTENKPNIIFL